MTTIVQQVAGEGNLPLPNPVGVGNTLVYVGALRGAGVLSLPGFTAAVGSTNDGQNTAAILYRGPTTGFESQYPFGAPGASQMNGVFFEVAGPLTLDQTDEVLAGGFTLASAAITVAAGSFVVGIRAQGVGGGYDSVASAVHYTTAAGWTEDLDHYTTGGHPTVVVAHRLDAGTYTFETTNDLPSGDASIVQVASFAGPPPPIDPGPIVDVYDGDDVFLATLPAKDVKARKELNGVGSGSFSINRYTAEATAAILKPGNYVRVTIPQIDPDPIVGFFLDDGDFKLVASGEQGAEDIGFSGKGSLSYWTRAIWLNQSFLLPWWPQYIEDERGAPPAGTIGALGFAAGHYKRYTHSGGAITSTIPFSSIPMGFSSYYDRRVRVTYNADGDKTTLVRLTSGGVAGWWVKPWGAGVRDYRAKSAYAFGNSVLMESIDDGDKPGQVLKAMYDEAFAADRPINPIPRMTIDFDATTDSNGDAWATTNALAAVSAALGDDYLSTIGKLIGTGALDVEMGPDLDFHAFNALGRDLTSGSFATGKVRFEKGVNIADELVREFADPPIGTFAEVLGPNEGDVGRAILPTAADHPPREISIRGESSDPDVLEALGQSELAMRLLHSDAVGFNVAVPRIGYEDEEAGLYLPGPPGSARGNYWPGDYVRLDTGEGENDFDEADVRIAAVTMWFGAAGDLRAAVEVGSSLGGLRILGYPSSSGDGFTSSGGATTGGGSLPTSDLFQLMAERDHPDGYPSLDPDGLVAPSEIPVVEALRTDETDTTLRLAPDGTGGVEFVTGGASLIWKPVMDGLGNVVTDSGTGEAIMTEVSP